MILVVSISTTVFVSNDQYPGAKDFHDNAEVTNKRPESTRFVFTLGVFKSVVVGTDINEIMDTVPAHEDWLGVLVGTPCKFGTAVAEIF